MIAIKTGDPVTVKFADGSDVKGHLIGVVFRPGGRESGIEIRTGVARSMFIYLEDISAVDYDEERDPHPIDMVA